MNSSMLLQYEKVDLEIAVNWHDLSNLTDRIFEHDSKANSPINVTLFGISIDSKFRQYEKL